MVAEGLGSLNVNAACAVKNELPLWNGVQTSP